MKKNTIIMISMLMSAVVANAAEIQYSWEGIINRVGPGDGNAKVGDPVAGHFTIDNSAPVDFTSGNPDWDEYGALSNQDITAGFQTYALTAKREIGVGHSPIFGDMIGEANIPLPGTEEFGFGFGAPYGTFADHSLANADNIDQTKWTSKSWAIDFFGFAKSIGGQILNIYKKAYFPKPSGVYTNQDPIGFPSPGGNGCS
jgi:hypothetical protein